METWMTPIGNTGYYITVYLNFIEAARQKHRRLPTRPQTDGRHPAIGGDPEAVTGWAIPWRPLIAQVMNRLYIQGSGQTYHNTTYLAYTKPTHQLGELVTAGIEKLLEITKIASPASRLQAAAAKELMYNAEDKIITTNPDLSRGPQPRHHDPQQCVAATRRGSMCLEKTLKYWPTTLPRKGGA